MFCILKDVATITIYTLSLHDALPISAWQRPRWCPRPRTPRRTRRSAAVPPGRGPARRGRSEEHTSELQSHSDLVCRLLLEKKKRRVPGAVLPQALRLEELGAHQERID